MLDEEPKTNRFGVFEEYTAWLATIEGRHIGYG